MSVLLPLTLVLASLGVFVYAKRNPAWAERWSRLQPSQCLRCGRSHDGREPGMCPACECDECSEINVFDPE